MGHNTNNSFYISKGDYCFVLYETLEIAKAATQLNFTFTKVVNAKTHWGGLGRPGSINKNGFADYAAKQLTEELNSPVFVIGVNEPIFVVKRVKKYWHVIAGGRIGWIKTTDWPMYLKELEKK